MPHEAAHAAEAPTWMPRRRAPLLTGDGPPRRVQRRPRAFPGLPATRASAASACRSARAGTMARSPGVRPATSGRESVARARGVGVEAPRTTGVGVLERQLAVAAHAW